MTSFLYQGGRNWDSEVSKLRKMGTSMPYSPTQARAEAMNMQAAVNNRTLTASMNRNKMANYRGRQFTAFQGTNMQIALPKVRQPLGSLADKGIPFNVEDEEELKDIRRWSRLFYATHDLVPLLIDIYSKFPVVGLEFDSKDPLIKKFYEEMFLGELNYMEFLPDQLGREYFTVGEVTSLAHFNESLGVWSSEEILNPDMLRVSRSLFVQRDRVQLLVKDMVDNLRQGPDGGGGLRGTDETPSERLQRNQEYCCTPETRVLTESLEWVPVGSLALGDKIVAFDEFAPEDGTRTGRRWRGADVTATSIIQAPCYEVQTSQGSVTCTDQHMFLARREPKTGRGNNRGNGFPRSWQWIEAKDLRPGDEIKYMPTWEFEDTYEAGWLAGMFDGEGSLTVTPTTQNLVIYQNEGPVLDRIIEVLKKHKFDIYEQRNRTRDKGVQIYVRGGLTEVMRFIGTFRPERLSSRLAQSFHGKPLASKTLPPTAVVSSVTPVGIKDVVALATSTKTLITEGLFSHNTDLVRYYPEIIQAASQNDGLDISDALISRIVNRSTPWARRGTPHLLRSFRTLMTEESLMAAQDAVADRLYSPLVLATLGIEDMGDGEPWIPDQSELDDARDDLQAALAADFRLMVHNFGLKVENVFGRESVPNLDGDFDRVQSKLLQAWGIGEALISGGTGGAYASSALNREFVTQMMVGFQNSLRRHIVKRAEVIAEAQGHYDYDLKGGVRVPIYREIVETDPETGEEYIRKVPKLLIPDVKFSCVVPGTQVLTPTGQRNVEDIRPGDEVIAWDGTGYVIDTALHTGVERRGLLVEVTTATGRTVRCTADHPFWTDQGWVQAVNLTTDSLIRTSAGQLEAHVASDDDLDLLRFLGLLVGDGNYSTTHVSLSVSDPEIDRFVCEQAERMGLTARRKADARTDKVWYRSFTRSSKKGQPLRNPLYTLLREQGMWGSNGHTKRVPPMVWAAGAKGRAAFLSGYFDADGYACRRSGLKICSVNRALLDDCQVLFESLGIRAQVRSYAYHYEGQKNPGVQSVSHLTVSSNHYFQMLRDTLSPIIDSKTAALDDMARPTGRGRKTPRPVEWDQVTSVTPLAGGGEIVTLGITSTHTHVTAGLVSHNTLNLRDEAQERAFISQLKAMGVPVSDKTLAVNIDMEFDQELERQAEESVAKLMATAQAMAKVQKLCDEQNLPYPPELAQHLMSTLQLRQGKTQTELAEAQAVAGEMQAELQADQIEMQKVQMEQMMAGAGMPPVGGGMAPGGDPSMGVPQLPGGAMMGPQGPDPMPPGPEQAMADAGIDPNEEPVEGPAHGPNITALSANGPAAPGPGNPSAGYYSTAAKTASGLSQINGPQATGPAGSPPTGPTGMELPPGVPEPNEIPRNRQRPVESDSMRSNTPKQVGANRQRKRTRGGEEVQRPLSKFEVGPSSYGKHLTASEEQVAEQVKRLEVVANWDFSMARHPKVADLVMDPKFYRALNAQTYKGQLQADWPEILAAHPDRPTGKAADSHRILEDLLAQFYEVFGVEPGW